MDAFWEFIRGGGWALIFPLLGIIIITIAITKGGGGDGGSGCECSGSPGCM